MSEPALSGGEPALLGPYRFSFDADDLMVPMLPVSLINGSARFHEYFVLSNEAVTPAGDMVWLEAPYDEPKRLPGHSYITYSASVEWPLSCPVQPHF